MDLNHLRRLVRLMQQADLAELEIDDQKEGLRVHLKRGSEVALQPMHPPAPVVQVLGGTGAPAAPMAVAKSVGDEGAGSAGGLPPGTVPFQSPMVGTFYRSPSPESEAFVDVGTRISEESVICIIEAMKVMNEIHAEMKGEVVEVLVENGEPVEFGQPLFLIKKS